jgi:hypothetical protein
MQPVCANCRHWGELAWKNISPWDEARVCGHPEIKAAGQHSAYPVPITTLPSFGCNQFEAKDKQDARDT